MKRAHRHNRNRTFIIAAIFLMALSMIMPNFVSAEEKGKPTGSTLGYQTLDTVTPILLITSPRNGLKTNKEVITVTGKVSSININMVTVNGQQADLIRGNYTKRILLEQGENIITVVAKDAAGNEETKTVTVFSKTAELKIKNLTPTKDFHGEVGKALKIEFDSEAGLTATFSINMPLTTFSVKKTNAFELPLREVRPGRYEGYWTISYGTPVKGAAIEVKVRDIYGNETRKIADGKLFINAN
ncbi:hypothetical protein M3193_07860 [Sporosarcina luteola]|uniref:hypothetical protein n=1 Tax=Sporosarcina luteola TaxID=582850 RepID=UPI00203E7543|nr:hypothetical protein [Sporosarcina luteola]MCM3744056.1 hypothetical protein [Sporosarcina luteola]